MRKMIPAIGIAAGVVQLIRLWPPSLYTLLSAMVTGGIVYLSCIIGWENQKNRILKSGYQGWPEWGKRAIRGVTIFLILSITILFFSFNNPICTEFGSALYGRCEQSAQNQDTADQTIPFNPASKAIYPLLLAIAYYAGGAAMLRQYTSIKQQITPTP